MEPDLVRAAQQGDQLAFSRLIEASAARLYGVAYHVLRDAARAEDALQNALIAMWDDLPGLRDPARFEAWSYRLILRCSYREARSQRRWSSHVQVLGPGGGTAPDGLAALADRDEVERAFRALSPEHRAVLTLRYFADQTAPAIAEILAIPEGTVRSRLHYALEELRRSIDSRQLPAVVTARPLP